MKRTAILLLICMLVSACSFTVSAEGTTVEDWPYEPGVDYVDGEIVVLTNYLVDVSEYSEEGPFDFNGVTIVSIEALFDDSSEEAISDWVDKVGNKFSYHIVLSPDVSVQTAVNILKENSNIISAEPSWIFSSDPEPVYDLGDVNTDGMINMYDCLMLKSIYFETYEPSTEELSRADMNGDNVVDMYDYLAVKSACFAE